MNGVDPDNIQRMPKALFTILPDLTFEDRLNTSVGQTELI